MGSIAKRIGDAIRILETIGYKATPISVRELQAYMTGETVTGDTITVDQVLASDYFMAHEVAEMSELKRRGILLTKKTIVHHTFETYESHLVATEQELSYAVRRKDFAWIKYRLGQADPYWLDDPHLPMRLRPLYRSLIEKWAAVAGSNDDGLSKP